MPKKVSSKSAATPTFRDEDLRYEMGKGKATVRVMRVPFDTDFDQRVLNKSLASAQLYPDTCCLGFKNISVIPDELEAVLKKLYEQDHTKRKRYVLLGRNGKGRRAIDVGFQAGKPHIYGVQKLNNLNMTAAGIIVLETKKSTK